MSIVSDAVLAEMDKHVVLCMGSWIVDGKFEAKLSVKPLLEKAIELTEDVCAVRFGNARSVGSMEERARIIDLIKSQIEMRNREHPSAYDIDQTNVLKELLIELQKEIR